MQFARSVQENMLRVFRLTKKDKARLVELPLNSTIDDVIGFVDEHPGSAQTTR